MSDDITTRLIRARPDDSEVTDELARLRDIVLGVARTITTGPISERATIDEGFMLPSAVGHALARLAEQARDAEADLRADGVVISRLRNHLRDIGIALGVEWHDDVTTVADGVRDVVAERDRLRAALDRDPLRKSHHAYLTEVEAERDRLRAIVEAARELQRRIAVGTVHIVGDQSAARRVSDALDTPDGKEGT